MLQTLKRKANRLLYIAKYEGIPSLFGTVFRRIVHGKKNFREMHEEMLSLPTAAERFSRIYAENLWGGVESASGAGSDRKRTEKLRQRLPGLVEEYRIRTIVDAACGDFAWMSLIIPQMDVTYTGCDIVESVVRKNQSLFQRPGVSFVRKDITKDPLPGGNLLIARDCLFHLSFADIDSFLGNLATTEYDYLLTTTHRPGKTEVENRDIETGDFRLIDLFAAPFGFRRDTVLAEIEDFIEGDPARIMILVARKDVPTALEQV